MRKLRTTITFLLIIAAVAVLVSLLSGNRPGSHTGASGEEPVCGQGIDVTRGPLMCI